MMEKEAKHWNGLIYNMTVKVDARIADGWLSWIRDEHNPRIMATGCFTDCRVVRLLEVDESEGPTFALQYHAESRADYNRYVALHASALRQSAFGKWGDGFIAFSSLMEVVQ